MVGGQAVEQGRFAGVGIAHQGDDGVRDPAARLAVQFAGAAHLGEAFLEPDNARIDLAAVGFDLGFAGPANRAEAAALAFQMGPGSHQPAALIG